MNMTPERLSLLATYISAVTVIYGMAYIATKMWDKRVAVFIVLIAVFLMNLVRMIPHSETTYNFNDNKRIVNEAPKARNA